MQKSIVLQFCSGAWKNVIQHTTVSCMHAHEMMFERAPYIDSLDICLHGTSKHLKPQSIFLIS